MFPSTVSSLICASKRTTATCSSSSKPSVASTLNSPCAQSPLASQEPCSVAHCRPLSSTTTSMSASPTPITDTRSIQTASSFSKTIQVVASKRICAAFGSRRPSHSAVTPMLALLISSPCHANVPCSEASTPVPKPSRLARNFNRNSDPYKS